MPCRVELSEAELEASRQAQSNREIAKAVKPLQKRNDKLTHENDELREALLKVIEEAGMGLVERWLPKELLKKIEKDQVEHRKEDLRRLEETFRESMWGIVQQYGREAFALDEMKDFNKMLMKVQEADPTKPLEAQLGFDPDEY